MHSAAMTSQYHRGSTQKEASWPEDASQQGQMATASNGCLNRVGALPVIHSKTGAGLEPELYVQHNVIIIPLHIFSMDTGEFVARHFSNQIHIFNKRHIYLYVYMYVCMSMCSIDWYGTIPDAPHIIDSQKCVLLA